MIKQIATLLMSLIVSLTAVSYAIACSCGCKGNNCGASQQSTLQDVVEEKVQCPVMKTWILPIEAADLTEYNGKTYYFCCGGCKEKFLAEPETYIEGQS